MYLKAEHELDNSLAENHFTVLFHYAQESETQVLINEFMQTKLDTITGVRNQTDVDIHLHDVFDLHPTGKEHKERLQQSLQELRKEQAGNILFDQIHFHSTTPLEVDQPQIVADGPYDLVYVNLPYKLPQSPNSVDLVVSETIKLWWWALAEGGVMIIPDYNKANIRRSTDAWVKAKNCNTEKYLNTNWDRPDLEEDHFMIALQKNGEI